MKEIRDSKWQLTLIRRNSVGLAPLGRALATKSGPGLLREPGQPASNQNRAGSYLRARAARATRANKASGQPGLSVSQELGIQRPKWAPHPARSACLLERVPGRATWGPPGIWFRLLAVRVWGVPLPSGSAIPGRPLIKRGRCRLFWSARLWQVS
jgi:hypothetical protein